MALDIGSLLAGFPAVGGGIPIDSSTPPFVPPPVAPAANPQVEQNKGLWRGFLDKLDTDPNFRQAVMQTGLGLMKSQGVGQNVGDVASNALGAGVNTLQALREADRMKAIQANDAELKRRNVESEISSRTNQNEIAARNSETQARSTDASIKATETQLGQKDKDLEREQKVLDEMIKSNRNKEDIERQKIKVDEIRARAYVNYGAGSTPADITKIENLTKQYVANGMDEVGARARATTEISTTGKGKATGDRAIAIYSELMKGFLSQPGNIDKLTPEVEERLMKNAETMARRMEGLEAGTGMGSSRSPRAAAPTPPANINPTGIGTPANPMGVPDPKAQVTSMIAAAKAKGATPEQIKTALKNRGFNPTEFGY